MKVFARDFVAPRALLLRCVWYLQGVTMALVLATAGARAQDVEHVYQPELCRGCDARISARDGRSDGCVRAGPQQPCRQREGVSDRKLLLFSFYPWGDAL